MYLPPDRIRVEILEGFGRGVEYEAVFEPDAEGTRVEERLRIPGWRGRLAALAEPWIARRMRRVWEEDLATRMCRGGWPGIAAVGIRLPDPVR